jgi:hypothetical protein
MRIGDPARRRAAGPFGDLAAGQRQFFAARRRRQRRERDMAAPMGAERDEVRRDSEVRSYFLDWFAT